MRQAKYILMIGMMIVLNLFLASAWFTNTFNNSLSEENITFTQGQNVTRYVSVPASTFVSQGFLNISNYYSKGYNLVESYVVTPDTYFVSTPTRYGGQTFTIGSTGENTTFSITGIAMNLSVPANADIVNFSIWSLNSSGQPDVLLGRNSTFNTTGVVSSVPHFVNVTMPHIKLAKGTKYALIVEKPKFNEIRYQAVSVGAYAGGAYLDNSAGFWVTGAVDNLFRVYSNETKLENMSIWVGNQMAWVYPNFFNKSENRTNNLAGHMNTYLSTCSFVAGFCDVPINFSSGTAGDIQLKDYAFSSLGFVENYISFNATTFESKTESFTLNITYDPAAYTLALADFVYNNTIYPSTTDVNGNNMVFSTILNIPLINTTSINNTFYWALTLTNATGITYYNSTFNTQFVLKLPPINMTIQDCKSGFFRSLTINFTDEETNNPLNVSVNYNFRVSQGTTLYSSMYGSINNTNYLNVCINNTINYTLNYGELDYIATNYVERRYYIYQNIILQNAVLTTSPAFDLFTTHADAFQFQIRDTGNNPYTNKLISLLRWYPNLNMYQAVEYAITDENGQSVMKLVTDDVDYRIAILELNGTLIYMTNSTRISCTTNPCTYSVSVRGTAADYYSYLQFQSNLSFNTLTNRFVYVWNDPTSKTTYVELYAYKETGSSSTLLCSANSTLFIGALSCYIGNNTGMIVAKTYRTTDVRVAFDTLTKIIRAVAASLDFKLIGILVAAVLTMMAGLMYIYNPIASILGVIVVWLIPVLTHSISFSVYMAIVTMGGIAIYILLKE